MFKRPLVAFDGSEASLRALIAGCEFCACMDLPLCTVTVIDGAPDYMSASGVAPLDASTLELLEQQRVAYGAELFRKVHEMADRHGITDLCAETAYGDPLDSIMTAIELHRCDLLVIGLRVHPGLIERLLPRTGRMLTERAPCSVLSVR
jgi:nucleotide-binding universal stress UspA family protein